jgi:hypothetical protein
MGTLLYQKLDSASAEARAMEKRVSDLEAAIVRLNDVLNELWGRDPREWATQIAAIMEAQNAAFVLVGRRQ